MTPLERIAFQSRIHAGIDAALRRLPTDSRRRQRLQLSADRARAALQRLEEQVARERALRFAGRADMIKALPDRVELYDARQRLLGVVPPVDAEQLRIAFHASGKMPHGRHPAFMGGATREPGVATWWRRDGE